MKHYTRHISLFLFLLLSICTSTIAQYEFDVDYKWDATEVKNQQKTGTCWSYATISFLESEYYKKNEDFLDLSEMYIVRNVYLDKARNYLLRQGKANFSEGALSHDMLRTMGQSGLMPQDNYMGKCEGVEEYNHGNMVDQLKVYLDSLIKLDELPLDWETPFSSIMDSTLSVLEPNILMAEKEYTPTEFRDYLGFKVQDYINITSFTHHPFDEWCILELPDNYSNGSYKNVPLDKLVQYTNEALRRGYTISWDGDVSEKGFSSQQGLAILPLVTNREDLFDNPGAEVKVTQEMRQDAFETYRTTDDHLMHIIGKAKDQEGTPYYIIKNSWGERGPYEGYLMMSEAYFKLKTVAITLNKEAIKPTVTKQNLKSITN